LIKSPDPVKRYSSAKARFMKPAIMNFFATEFPHFFGPYIRDLLADKIISFLEAITPDITSLRPGQLIWIALDKNTRGDSPDRKFVPVILDLITEEDVEKLTRGVTPTNVAMDALARLFRQAYQQGGILSSRDAGLIMHRYSGNISLMRLQYEKLNDCILPHTGVLHDMGSSISHKSVIVTKSVIEKKDPALVAMEVNHSQSAVDRYRKDYFRVKTAYLYNPDPEFISRVTGFSKLLVLQYIEIIKNENI